MFAKEIKRKAEKRRGHNQPGTRRLRIIANHDTGTSAPSFISVYRYFVILKFLHCLCLRYSV